VEKLKASKVARETPTHRTSFLLNHGWVMILDETNFWLWNKKLPSGKILKKTMATALRISGYIEFLLNSGIEEQEI